MSIFPFIDGDSDTITESIIKSKAPKEYAWDFALNEFILKDGKPLVVEGLEAIKVWIYKALYTNRYSHIAYSWDYGSEIEGIIGQGKLSKSASESEVKRYIEEALLVNPHIVGIKDLVATFDEGKINLEFTVITDYGEVNV